MEQAAFLDRIRANMQRPTHPNLPHPMPPLGGPVPVVEYAEPVVDPVARFAAAAGATGAVVRMLSSDADVHALVRDVVEAHGVRTAVRSLDPEAELGAAAVAACGVRVDVYDNAADAADADLGITGAAFGIAATGSLVLSAARAGSRASGLLPPVHLALLRADAILADSSRFFRELSGRFPDGLPSQFVLATGPSRSADIELVITVGVHGPGHVWIGILA